MSVFTVESPLAFLNSDIEANSDAVSQKLRNFPWLYLKSVPERVIDHELSGFFQDLQRGRFWAVLARIDGSFNYLNPDSEEKRAEARNWARQHFNDYELQQILNMCIETALRIPFKTSLPGTYKGHSVLFRELVDKPDSMFGDVVTEKFRKLLNNGRLWEEIPDMVSRSLNRGVSFRIVDDVLTNHFADLEAGFAPRGYEMFCRNDGEQDGFCLVGLSSEAKKRYAEFFNQVSKQRDQLGLSKDQIAHLISPLN
jgi:hypothetical protein